MFVRSIIGQLGWLHSDLEEEQEAIIQERRKINSFMKDVKRYMQTIEGNALIVQQKKEKKKISYRRRRNLSSKMILRV